jgi:hypothetical protein
VRQGVTYFSLYRHHAGRGRPRRCWRVRILDFDPVRCAPRPIRPVPALGDDALKPHGAGVSKNRLAVSGVHVIGKLDAVTNAAAA